MTYSVGSTILRDDYNIFATGAANGSATNSGNVNNLWGTGNSQYGWGQSTTINSVSAGGQITASQWSTLTSRINSIRSHQTGSGVTFTNTTGGATSNFTAGQTIYQVSNLSSALSSAYTAANTASATTGSMAAYSTSAYAAATVNSKTISNSTTTTFNFSVALGSYDQMRYFFNTGGYLEFTCSMVNTGTSKTQSWSNLASDIGTVRFGGLASVYSGYSGVWNTNTNYYLYNAPGTKTLWWKKYNDTGIADYNLNYVQCSLYLSGSTLYFELVTSDAAADTFNDTIDNPFVWNCQAFQAGTSYVTNTWSTITITAS